MSQDSLFQQVPKWVWWSFFPGFGGLAIAYAGQKSNTPSWVAGGVAITIAALALSSTNLSAIIWLAQIVTAFSLKKRYLIKTSPRGLLIPEDADTATLIANIRGKIDINDCCKNDLVNVLGLPIVYANDIESLQNEGYIFTHLEELSEIAGIPEIQVKRIAPMVTFSYDYKKEVHLTWKRLNILSGQELIECGIEPAVAKKIFEERRRKGEYRSVIDVKRRTGIPFHSYRQIL
ncbi:helix-hairpin-helix domain-containing protein [Kamptonema sp. UHCC 0994]|uniref:helix-hairpin-helix domain-containing protein n=1 Tax=Kamptonema sp. UHCC 0994 TaxID=3031329 RepID=UPI0023B97255|nr:helix-hairpin-helix domain-containing protein [Kamptonema sp. UHCC 0994]MDF0555956.1 helix-hairpin-helix domain-containing protein [Kamptonema sp. UHCC 0994]